MIHKNYLLLTEKEKEYVDLALFMIMEDGTLPKIPLRGDDECEKVAEAMAIWVINSREK